MARAVLEGPKEEGRASYQVQMTVCEECGAGRQQAGGERVPVEEPAVATAMCDARVVPTLEVAPGATPSPVRATQRVPKGVRAKVVRRDGGRCAVPGCGNHLWLDVHHTEPLADGGNHDPDQLCTLCGPHHRAAHEGRLIVDGTHASGFRFTYPDGSSYGAVPPRPVPLDTLSTVTELLTGLGFKLREANDAVKRIRDQVAPGARTEDVLRAALRAM